MTNLTISLSYRQSTCISATTLTGVFKNTLSALSVTVELAERPGQRIRTLKDQGPRLKQQITYSTIAK